MTVLKSQNEYSLDYLLSNNTESELVQNNLHSEGMTAKYLVA